MRDFDTETVNLVLPTFHSIRRVLLASACVAGLLYPATLPAEGQSRSRDAPLLISDSLSIDPEGELFVASGNVEIYFEGAKLTAPSVTYDQAADRIAVEGPFVLTDASGSSVTFGEFAEVTPDLAEGVFYAVRQVIEQNLQVTAGEVRRSGGNLTEFQTVRASSCRVCEGSVPIWEVRAREAVHDEEAKTVTYRHAQLRIRNIPVAYTPWLRMPDPSVSRADGFLPPTITVNSVLGNRIGVPYFKTLGDSADVTVTPNISLYEGGAGQTMSQTLEARYRQFFYRGYVEMHGAVSTDDLTDDDLRAYLFSNGLFRYDNGFELKFQTQSASDRTYVGTYDFFAEERETFRGDIITFADDRLTSSFSLNRSRPGELIDVNYMSFVPLREPAYLYDTANSILNAQYTRTLSMGELPGQLRVNLVGQGDANNFGPTNARRMDVSRGSLNLSWTDRRNLGDHLKWQTDLGIFLDRYSVEDDATYGGEQSGSSKFAMTRLEWPILRETETGGTHSLTPSLQFMTFRAGGLNLPAIDGTSIDLLDPYNYSNLGRFPRIDRQQAGAYDISTAEVDLTYRYRTAAGYYLGGGVSQDFILSTSNPSLEDARLYTLQLGKDRGALTYGLAVKYNVNGDRISDSAAFKVPIGPLSMTGDYLRQDRDQAFVNADPVERWSLGISGELARGLTVAVGTTFNAYEDDASFVTGSVTYDRGEAWRAMWSGKYDRDLERYDQIDAEVRRRMDWGGDIFATMSDDFDTTNRRELGLVYDNECIQFRAGVSRVENATTGLDATTELSIELKLGSFGAENAKTCG